ncbi:MAG: hypothetical protein AB7U52_02655 [Candidatus Izemoplasmatales bacterium]
MIKTVRPRIYSKFEINTIVFYGTILLFTPLVLVFTYVFGIEQVFDIKIYILILVIVSGIIGIVGTIILFIKRDHLKRQVKATYISEFYYLVTISIFGILGFIVLYNYLGGSPQYIANIFILLLVVFVYILLTLGRKFFNLNYSRKK